jgi:TolB protein
MRLATAQSSALSFMSCLFVLLALAGPVQADLTIEITQGVDNPVPIAVVPFGWDDVVPPPEDVGDIVRFDLARSGQFAMTAPEDMLSLPSTERDLFFRDWRIQGVSYVTIGKVARSGDDYSLSWGLYDVVREERLAGSTLTGPRARLRDMSHEISDIIFEQLTGIPGAFSTRILYVVAQNIATENEMFRLEMADADGARPNTLLESREPILSAEWAPDAKSVAYVSFETGKPAIYLQEIASGRREKLTDFEGLNGAPSFSPDAVTRTSTSSICSRGDSRR